MALNPEERIKDTQSEIGYAINPLRHLREPLFTLSIQAESKIQQISIEEARKYKFQEILRKFQEKATSDDSYFGIIERNSEAFQDFITAIHVIFTPEQIRKFKEDARPRFRIFRELMISGVPAPTKPSKKEIKDSEDFFQNKFKPYSLKPSKSEKNKPEKEQSHAPDPVLLSQHALESRNIRLIIQRLLSEAEIGTGGARGDLRSILRRRPEIGADIGAILLAKEILDGIEYTQEIKSNGLKALQSAGRTIQETGAAHFSDDLKGVHDQIRSSMNDTKKDYYWGPVGMLILVPLRAAVPAIRALLSIPLGLIVGAKDAFTLTGHGNERPRK